MTGNVRTLIRVDISISRPWAVGGVARTGDDVGLPILVDPRSLGNTADSSGADESDPIGAGTGGPTDSRTPYLPATSLVGSLRRHLDEGGGLLWLGPADSTEERPASPSRIRCLGTQLSGTTTIARRTTTKIDAVRQAAFERMLRVEEIVPVSDDAPTIVRWWLQLDRSCDRLPDLLSALRSWQPFVGRRRSIGQGDAAVTEVSFAELDLGKETDLTWWLSERHRWDGLSDDHQPPGWGPSGTEESERSSESERYDFDEETSESTDAKLAQQLMASFAVVEPMYIGGGEVKKSPGGRGETHVSQRQIPGSSWKGLFRQRVEHILKVSGYSETDPARVVNEMFGSGRERGSSSNAGERGKLRFHTTVLPHAVKTVTRTHVAIDRVTGGAHDRSGKPGAAKRGGALFSVEAIAVDTLVELRIDSTNKLTTLERRLLEHVVRDIGDGLVGVGGLTSRGYGTLKLTGSRDLPDPVVSATPTREEER